jgi:hypothetical protein
VRFREKMKGATELLLISGSGDRVPSGAPFLEGPTRTQSGRSEIFDEIKVS